MALNLIDNGDSVTFEFDNIIATYDKQNLNYKILLYEDVRNSVALTKISFFNGDYNITTVLVTNLTSHSFTNTGALITYLDFLFEGVGALVVNTTGLNQQTTQLDVLNALGDIETGIGGLNLEATQLDVLNALGDIDTNTTGLNLETTQQDVLNALGDIDTNTTGLNLETTQQDVLTAINNLDINITNGLNSGVPFSYWASLGNVPGWNFVVKHGKRSDIDNNTEQLLWPFANTKQWLSVAQVLQISSASILDVNLGTGAMSVFVRGLNATWNTVTEIVLLNGQTSVNTVNSYFRITQFEVIHTGTTRINQGNIYIGWGINTSGVNSIPEEIIPALCGIPQSGKISVGVGKKLQISSLMFTCNSITQEMRPASFSLYFRVISTGTVYKSLDLEIREEINYIDTAIMRPLTGPVDVWVATTGLVADATINFYSMIQYYEITI